MILMIWTNEMSRDCDEEEGETYLPRTPLKQQRAKTTKTKSCIFLIPDNPLILLKEEEFKLLEGDLCPLLLPAVLAVPFFLLF